MLRLLVESLGSKSIARRLDIAVGTVKSHPKCIFEKLQVSSRTQAIHDGGATVCRHCDRPGTSH